MATAAVGQGIDALVGIWVMDDGFQITELLLRSDGRYYSELRSADPGLGYLIAEKGHYEVSGGVLTLIPYEFLGEPQGRSFGLDLAGGILTLTRIDFEYTEVYQYKPGSREDVLGRESAPEVLIGKWDRTIQFFGDVEYTFRPGGYYVVKSTPESGPFPPEFIRGRYEVDGNRLTIMPYSGVAAEYELDFFGTTLTLITRTETFGESATYVSIPGSEAEVRAKAAEADAFLGQENWQVGVWEIRDNIHTVDLTIRPDGYYTAEEDTEFLEGIVRGRYNLEARRIDLMPFVGQGIYARSNGEFGKVERTRELDYYDGELQFIDLNAISQSVTLARKRAGSQAPILQKVEEAVAERAIEDWYVGIWEVNDPVGWMEFTFRPDGRYIAKSGTAGVPSHVERGRYKVSGEKVTLAPYSGLGAARGFALDLYDGDLFLIGDLNRMVVARKIPGSEAGVIQKTIDPDAIKGELGGVLGLWTANMPGLNEELVFRQDGHFRLNRCNNSVSQHYGLYTVNMANRTMVYDSRFVPVQTLSLDFYGDTMTLHGGNSAPRTYKVNLGTVDAAIAASHAADAAEAQVDGQWITRIPVDARDPGAVQVPTGDIPADPNPERIFESPTVFTGYQLYRRLIPTFVYFDVNGSIRSVAVVNTREWHFFPTGRVMVRFKNHRAAVYPNTVEDVSITWGAYHVAGKPVEQDILHVFADNGVFFDMDSGEEVEMTLEDGRRHLFWDKDYQIQSQWASEQKVIPCELPANPDAALINTGISLATDIEPDPVGEIRPGSITISGPVNGNFTISGSSDAPAEIVVEMATALTSPIQWEASQTNTVTAGAFSFQIPQGTSAAAFYRVRSE